METLYLLIPLSVVLVFAAGAVFWWALGSGQFEDLEGPAHRILTDDLPFDADQNVDRRAD
jgi:cbb3-type cytochrome oxidase maturation protein